MNPTLLRSLRFPALVASLALAGAPGAAAQVVIDDFEDGDLSGAFVFSGGENGTLTTTAETPDGSAFAVQFDVDGDDSGGFNGFGQPIDGGAVDVTGFEQPVLELDIAATGTFTLEINFQNTGGGGEGEIRNALRFVGADGTYRRYALSLASFFTTNPATFEYDDVFQYVFTLLDITGDGNGATLESRLRIDNVRVVEGLTFQNVIPALTFDDGDYSDTNGFFYFAGGEGITAAPTPDTPDGSTFAFDGRIDGDEYGGFAGFGATLPGAPIDVTSTSALNFYLRANGPAIMEVNIQTGAPAGGDEVRERIRVSDTGGAYRRVSIPLEAFIQSSANVADLREVYNIVFTFVEVPGDADPNTTELAFAIDAVGFGLQGGSTAAEAPPSQASALAVYPNPAAGADLATVAFDLAAPTAVRVEVYDVLGRRVATLADEVRAAGPVRLALPTGALAPGAYVVHVRAGAGASTARLTVVR